MDFLKILLSTLILAVITALVFFAMYFLFPDVAESQFGVSVNYAPERVPVKKVQPAESRKAEEPAAPPVKKVEEAPAPVKETVKEAEPVKEEEAPVISMKEKEPEPTREEVIDEMLSEGGRVVRDFVESAKMQVVLALIPEDVQGGINADPATWSDNDVLQINKIGDYLLEHGIDIDKETSVVKLPKLINQLSSGTLPGYLQDFMDFVKKEVRF